MADHPKVVVLDFDGVVCDSTDECMVTSWNAWQKWLNRPGFRSALGEFSDEEKQWFRSLRPYVRGAGEYYVLMRSREKGIGITGQEMFDQLRGEWSEKLEAFKEGFYKARDRLRSEDIEAWIKLHPVFEDVIFTMKRLNKEHRLYIATLKDGESVRLILEYYGIVLPPSRLLDQARISSKLEALDHFLEAGDVDKRDLVFIDDNVTHLYLPQEAGYRVFLAGWGTSLEEHRRLASEKSIPVIMNIGEGNL